MCGIAGILYEKHRPVERCILQQMVDQLQHRGPDDQGIYVNAPGSINVGMGHRRLSIIDLSPAGHQPMSNEDGTVWITFNGEIYNHQVLRQQLIARGHVFKSQSDTEVILHGYEAEGEQIFNQLNGMFAFGLWDQRKQIHYLVRDRFGQKPLYYWRFSGGLVYASELKALIKHPELAVEIDFENLARYLSFEYLPAPYTILENVYKLLPGYFLKWQDQKTITNSYWSIQFTNRNLENDYTVHDAKAQLLALLKISIQRRLMSDVPLGVFLSGGLDSSSLVALMAELMPAKQIKTFSIGFEETSFDESNYAKIIAEHFGTEHHQEILTPEKMLRILPDIWKAMDEPFADASIIPTYLLSKFTAQHVKVALGGDGGDELFAGYDPFLAHRFAGYYEKIPRFFHQSMIKPLADLLPVSTQNMSFDFKIKQFLKGSYYSPAVRHQIWMGAFSRDEQQAFFSKDILKLCSDFDPYADLINLKEDIKYRNIVDEIVFLFTRFYLAEDILTKVDRASMLNSLEVRSPFLDVEFSEFVNNLSPDLKLKRFSRKYILKKSMEYMLPKQILTRKKKGFGIPLSDWLKKDLKPLLLDVFSVNRLKKENIFNPQAVENLLSDHFEGRKDNRKQIWTLLMFEMWKEKFV